MFSSITTLVINPHFQRDVRYHGAEDFEPIARHVMQPGLWVTLKSASFAPLKELIEYARKNPGQLRVSRQGCGVFSHLISAELMARNRGDIQVIPFTGAPESLSRCVAETSILSPICLRRCYRGSKPTMWR